MPPKRNLPSKHRRKPFSNKQKKQQLQEKRQRKREKDEAESLPVDVCVEEKEKAEQEEEEGEEEDSSTETGSEGEIPVAKLNLQPSVTTGASRYDPNRYKLHFRRETPEEVEERKRVAQTKPIISVPESSLEVGVEDVYLPGSVLDVPRRPPWDYHMSKEEVERREETMFQEYLSRIHSSHRPEDLSHFEHNLETWRQLWRVLEISDVVLLITDVRHPTLHFSPALYSYVVDDLKKKIILVLNKVDLVPPQVAVAWRHYFLSHFPQLKVICFTCQPNKHASTSFDRVSLQARRRGKGGLPSAVGSMELFKVVEEMYTGKVDLVGWQQKLMGSVGQEEGGGGEGGEGAGAGAGARGGGEERGGEGGGDSGLDDSDSEEEAANPPAAPASASPHPEERGMITIGMVGHPNVGKSSILNGLMGKKMVSTSRTPGHTKHFQTIFLTRSIRLCDCPGLVFPSRVGKQMQVLSGLYPVAQVREPYTAIGYLAQRAPLTSILKLVHPNLDGGGGGGGGEEEVWTAWDICDAWAKKRNFYTSRAARLDTYRAANNILRLAVDGRISLYFRPPGYSRERATWESHAEVAEMIELQQRGLAGKSVPDGYPGNLDVPSDHSDQEEGGESLDEGQWSSDGGEGGGEEVREEGEDRGEEGEPVDAAVGQRLEPRDDS